MNVPGKKSLIDPEFIVPKGSHEPEPVIVVVTCVFTEIPYASRPTVVPDSQTRGTVRGLSNSRALVWS